MNIMMTGSSETGNVFESLLKELNYLFYEGSSNNVNLICSLKEGVTKIIRNREDFDYFLNSVINSNRNEVKIYSISEEDGLNLKENQNKSNLGFQKLQDITIKSLNDTQNTRQSPTNSLRNKKKQSDERSNRISMKKIRIRLKKKAILRRIYKPKLEGPFKIKKHHSISKIAARRDLIEGKEKYLMTNLDRYKKKIPDLAKSQELADTITEWFYFSKEVVKQTLEKIQHNEIGNINAFLEYNSKCSLRIRFQVFYKKGGKAIKLNKSFSFYFSGIDKNWNLETGIQKMSNFLEFATKNIEDIYGPISLKDF